MAQNLINPISDINLEEFKITVLLCSNRNCTLIKRTLDALKTQEIKNISNYELIIVDNSFSGQLANYVAAIKATFPYPMHYLHEPRKGKPFALNVGISVASYPIISFIDDDMVPAFDYLKNIRNEFLKHSEIHVLTGRVLMPKGCLFPVATNDKLDKAEFTYPTDPWKIGSGNSITIKKEVFEKVGPYDVRFGNSMIKACEDVDLNYRILKAGFKVFYSPEVVSYHFHARNTEEDYLRTMRIYGEGAGVFYLKYFMKLDCYVLKLFAWTIEWVLRAFFIDDPTIVDSSRKKLVKKQAWFYGVGMLIGMLKFPLYPIFYRWIFK